MWLHQIKKYLWTKGNWQQNEKAEDICKWSFAQEVNIWIGEDICKWYIQWGVNTQNIYRIHKTQHQNKKHSNKRNGQRSWLDIFPKKKYRWAKTNEKNFNSTNHGNANRNQMAYHLTPLRWLLSKRQ